MVFEVGWSGNANLDLCAHHFALWLRANIVALPNVPRAEGVTWHHGCG